MFTTTTNVMVSMMWYFCSLHTIYSQVIIADFHRDGVVATERYKPCARG